ncbi:MAG TPA: IclR family transcriptional regulator [Thermomicrobiales bacterium]|nr:IclR family transcriptional regulator [Thermomicrobiales bacterium]
MQNDVMPDGTASTVSAATPDDKYKIASVQRAMALLGAFLEPPHQFGVSELSRMLGQTKNQTFRLLQTLADEGAVVIDTETKKYSLGYRMLELGIMAQKGSPLTIALSPIMDQLALESGETVVLTRMADDMSAICVDKRESSQALQISARIGSRISLHAGAGSKALLAFSSPEFIERFLARAQPLRRYLAGTITDPDELRAELAHIRERGYSVSDNDLDEGAASVSAPIRNHRGEVVAAISVASPRTRFTPDDFARNRQLVLNAAINATNRLQGYR